MESVQKFGPVEFTEVVNNRLGSNRFDPENRVTCQSDCGILFLKGRVSSFFFKQLAQEAVLQIAEATQVVNEIEVT